MALTFTFFQARLGEAMRLIHRSCGCSRSRPDLVVIVTLFLLAETLRWPDDDHDRRGVIALVYIAIIVRRVQRTGRGPVLLNRDVWLIFVAYIAILWNLWLFGFWSVRIVKESLRRAAC